MKTAELKKALTKLNGTVSKRATLPVLAHVLIEVSPESTTLTTSNLEAYFKLWIDNPTDQEFSVCVDYVNLKKLIGKVKAKDVKFGYKEKTTKHGEGEDTYTRTEYNLTLQAGKATYTLKGLHSDEFPPMGEFDDLIASFDNEVFLNDYKYVQSVASTDEARPVLMGVLLTTNMESDSVTLAATDGFRIAKVDSNPHSILIPEFKTIISPSAINLKHAVGVIAMYHKPGQLKFTWQGGELVLAEIDGNYPDYMAIYPKESTFSFNASSKEIAEACEEAGVIAAEGTGVVKLGFYGDTLNICNMNATSEEMGEVDTGFYVTNSNLENVLVKLTSEKRVKESDETLDAVKHWCIAFQYKFLKEVVQVGETVCIEANTHNHPILISTEENSRSMVIMPMNLG